MTGKELHAMNDGEGAACQECNPLVRAAYPCGSRSCALCNTSARLHARVRMRMCVCDCLRGNKVDHSACPPSPPSACSPCAALRPEEADATEGEYVRVQHMRRRIQSTPRPIPIQMPKDTT
eukprot:658025-Pleurochrysis_carterae.AAC.1